MKKLKFALIAVLLGASTNALSQEGFTAPLGLSWGDSKEKLVKEYGAQPAAKNDTRLKLFLLSSPPVKVPGFDEFYGVIDDKLGLVKVVVIENIKDDAYGAKGIEDYKKLKDILSKKYGKADSQYEFIGRELYKDRDEFYQCLAYQGCGAYSAFYKPTGGGDIALEIKGQRRGIGYISINYESTLFDKVLDENKNDAKNQAEQGL
jgi:hypothetical protein